MKILAKACYLMALAIVIQGYANTETVDGITWTYTVSNGKASIGGGSSSSTAVPTSTSGTIVIPSTLGGNPVTHIGGWAFCNCSGVTSVTIPDGVAYINQAAFANCSGLTSVIIPKSVTSISLEAFYGCESLANITIPEGITSIGSKTFFGCSSLTSVIIPDGVTDIRDEAFSGCSKLRSVIIPDSVMKIGDKVFDNCNDSLYNKNSILGVILVDGWAIGNTGSLPGSLDLTTVRGIGGSAFRDCNRLTSVILPDGITDIGPYAFCSSGLTNVTIPNSVTSIGRSAFAGCRSLTNVTIPNGVTSIGDYAFASCRSLTNVAIPSSVTSIGMQVFYNSKASLFDTMTIPGVMLVDGWVVDKTDSLVGSLDLTGIRGVGVCAFEDCRGLTSVTIPGTVMNIAPYMFSGCRGLTSVTIGEGVTHIEDQAFYGCRGLTSVTIPDSVTSIGNSAFSNCIALTNVAVGGSVTNIGYYAFSFCVGLKSVVIPDSVTSIGFRAFGSCSGLTSVTIGDGVTNIGSEAFSGCSGLTSVAIPDSVISIGSYAFSGCSGLTSVAIGDGVTHIEDNTFYGCSGLTSVAIPDGVTSIGNYAFSGCSGLTSVAIGNRITSIGESAFGNCSGLTSIHVIDLAAWCRISFPDSSSNPLSHAHNLFLNGSLVTDLVIPDGVPSIGNYAFSGCSGLTSVLIGKSVKNIGNYAFFGCSGLTNMTIPDSITSIGNSAFSGCSGLTNITIGDGVTRIESDTFSGCSGLTCVIVPDNVTSIGNSSFSGCSGLTSVMIPNCVTNIGSYAFMNCSLTNVVFEGDAPYCDSGAFDGITSSCVASVLYTSTGWGVEIPGTWSGMTIRYQAIPVTFNLGEHCIRTGGGELEQTVEYQSSAIAPEVVVNEGWEFYAWDSDFSCVVSNMVVNALCLRVYAPSEVVCTDVQGVSFPWTVGTNGVAAAKGYDDATVSGGKSVKFAAADDSSVWMETTVTNACCLSFDWKCSCEGLVKGCPYDYLSFTVDGTQMGFICGETDWTNVTFYVMGEGEHHLRWMFLRDNDGSSGGDCAWLANVNIGEIPPATFGEYLNWPEQVFTTDGDNAWLRVNGVSMDGYALRSGAITHSQTSRLETVVSGPGTITFSCKVAGEIVKKIVYDGLAFCIDGTRLGDLMGNADWEIKTFEVTGNGMHTLSWLYVKDEDGTIGEDCAWVDAVTWTPASVSVDVGGGKSVSVPQTWLDEHPAIVAAAGGDKTAALRNTAANGRTSVVECYVVGLDPEKADEDFKITSLPMKADGTPDLANIVFDPPQAEWNVPGATPVVKGAATLDGEWQTVTEDNKAGFRFFKVVVEVP